LRPLRGERVLVVGLSIEGVESCSWDAAEQKAENVANFSTVIYYLPTLADDYLRRQSTLTEAARSRLLSAEKPVLTEVSQQDQPSFAVNLRQMYRQMISTTGRLAVFVGDPRTPLSLGSSLQISMLFPWFPAIYDEENQVTEVDEDWPTASYLRQVASTPYTLGRRRGDTPDTPAEMLSIMALASEADAVGSREVHVLANGRGGVSAVALVADLSSSDGIAERLEAVFLPKLRNTTAETEVGQLLEDICGIQILAQEPSWANTVQLPSEVPSLLALAELEGRREALDLAIQLERDRRLALRRFVPLLWATGAELESLVRDALRYLGAHVSDPVSRSEEDGIVMDCFGRGWVLEVKGNEGILKQRDVEHAYKHATEVIARTEGEFVGRALLVVNAERLEDPSLRQRSVPRNAERVAAHWSVSILFAEMLLVAVAQKQMEAFDESAFWAAIDSASVVADLPADFSSLRNNAESGD
jgi:hypothetical protein